MQSSLNFAESFDRTLREFNISGKELAEKSGISESSISRFRRGKQDIPTSDLQTLILHLPTDAVQFLFLNCFIGVMDERGIAMILQAISTKIREDTSSTDRLNRPFALAS